MLCENPWKIRKVGEVHAARAGWACAKRGDKWNGQLGQRVGR